MAISAQAAKATIDQIFAQYDVSQGPQVSLLPAALTSGKVYEAWVLCEVLRHLYDIEGYSVTLRRSTRITLKSSPGPINRTFPYFELTRASGPTIEVWTDVEFLAISRSLRPAGLPLTRGDYHELDIVAVPAGTAGRPSHASVLIGVECKNTGYTKDLLRSVLGVRRELSLLRDAQKTCFTVWPRATVPADPASCLMVYSTDPAVISYDGPGSVFGVDFVHLPLP